MRTSRTTLTEFLRNELKGHANASDLTELLEEIARVVTRISHLVARGGIDDITGKLQSENVQGEVQMKLDVVTNDLFIDAFRQSGIVAGIASEEMDSPLSFPEGRDGKFLVVFDPLDGSSNVPVNVSIGSIFSILGAPNGRPPEDNDYLQPGSSQLASGYAIYGPSTMLVYTAGHGTHGFTLDSATETFFLTHANLRIPDTTSEFAINSSNARFWEVPVQQYVEDCIAGSEGVRERDFNMRWVGSMVADVHRILMRGGVYLYPRDNKKPIKAGRLRLMYEANPMSFIVEQAGGKGSTGREQIMGVVPQLVHQRVPVIMGSSQEVSLIERYHRDFDSGEAEKGYSPLFGERSLFHKMQ